MKTLLKVLVAVVVVVAVSGTAAAQPNVFITPQNEALQKENARYILADAKLTLRLKELANEIQQLNNRTATARTKTEKEQIQKWIEACGIEAEIVKLEKQLLMTDHHRNVAKLTTNMTGSRPPSNMGPSLPPTKPLPPRSPSVYGPNGGYGKVPLPTRK